MAEEKKAKIAVDSWLDLVDSGEYEASWEVASSFAKEMSKKDHWCNSIKSARESFGDVKSRELRSAAYYTQLPGAPDGEYYVFQFETEFENKSKSTEIVTPMKDGKKWKISGYYIR